VSNQPASAPTPSTVRRAGALVTLEGAAAVGFAIFLVVRGLLGYDQSVTSGYGTALWFAILGGAVLAAGIGLLLGQRWGRTIALMAQLLLLPVTWYVLTSHRWVWGVVLGVVVVAALVMLFAGSTSRWMAEGYAAPDASGDE
jgi:peptidoglycan/LPS O-acetylase OafA/YrhL